MIYWANCHVYKKYQGSPTAVFFFSNKKSSFKCDQFQEQSDVVTFIGYFTMHQSVTLQK